MQISIRRNLAATSSNPTLTTMAQELGIMPVLGMVISDEGLRLRPVCRMGKARDKEVWFQHLDDEGKADMREAIRKAWGKWNQLKVTSPLTAEAFRNIVQHFLAFASWACIRSHIQGDRQGQACKDTIGPYWLPESCQRP